MMTVWLGLLFTNWLAAFVPMLLFVLWNPGLFRRNERIPKRSMVLLVVLTALTCFWFVDGWSLGLQYQGAEYTHVVCIVNLVWLALLWALLFYARIAAPSFGANLLFHFVLFAWLSWYALPSLGELP
jgi:hypothetical protein